ncbi:MAG: peptide chain release factor N(5)-glutamine methyltransferase [Actinomycetota bacterium]
MGSREVVASVTELPEHEVVRLLMAATHRTRSQVLLGFDVTPDEQTAFEEFVARRLADEPLQYIEGTVPFGPVDLLVDERVLVPRPETEYLLELVTGIIDEPDVIVDLCTGSGNLAVALAALYPDARVYAVDLSTGAAEVAVENAERNGVNVHVTVGDLFAGLPDDVRGTVDLLISNPPYLAEHELADVPADVLAEPEMALVAGPEGVEVLERIAAEAGGWLSPDGVVACEISEFHGDRVLELFDHLGPEIVRDLTGRERFVLAGPGFKYR